MNLIDQQDGVNYQLKIYQNLESRLVKSLVQEIAAILNTQIKVAAQWQAHYSRWDIVFQWEVVSVPDTPGVQYTHVQSASIQELRNSVVGAVNPIVTEVVGIINQTLPLVLP